MKGAAAAFNTGDGVGSGAGSAHSSGMGVEESGVSVVVGGTGDGDGGGAGSAHSLEVGVGVEGAVGGAVGWVWQGFLDLKRLRLI